MRTHDKIARGVVAVKYLYKIVFIRMERIVLSNEKCGVSGRKESGIAE